VSLRGQCLSSILILAVHLGFAALSRGQDALGAKKRAVTVADTVRMTRVAGPLFASGYSGAGPQREFAAFSPDGNRFAVVLSKGNLENNTNEYSMLLFRTADIPRGARARKLVTFSSSSNREGISELNWLEDNDTILFLGARGKEATQIYMMRCSSGEVRRLTNHRTSLLSYAISASSHSVVYAAERPEVDTIDQNVLRHGFHVTTETLSDLERGKVASPEAELFLKKYGSVNEKRLKTQGPFDSGVNSLFLSPDGLHLVLKTDTTELPTVWNQYADENIRVVFRRNSRKGFSTLVLRYELIDTETGRSEVLLDAPATYSSSGVMWSPDSKSVILSGTYLPLNVVDSAEIEARRSSRFVIEVKLPALEVIKITNQDLSPTRWDPRTSIVQFRTGSKQGQSENTPQFVCYQRDGKTWKQLPEAAGCVNSSGPEIVVDQDLNMAPRIVAVDRVTRQKALVLDLNPQFGELAFGKVEEIHWTDTFGRPVDGGLYFPPDYVRERRYPLVIQTHGFRPHEFWIDGPHTTVFAAQPLASNGIMVLQVNDIFYDSLDTSQEPERVMSTYEKAVEYLDQKGMIDLRHVGLVGFSRTCLYVKYALTHSSLPFQAAVVADGFDVGYWQYVLHNQPIWAAEIESVVGAPPFGSGLQVWLKRSPGFLLDHVQTPLQIQALSSSSLLGEWDWFSGLQRLEKPVDLVYLPGGTHILVKPWDRMVSQEGSVDWLRFWLKGEEDTDPTKAQQLVRWHELRGQIENSSHRN